MKQSTKRLLSIVFSLLLIAGAFLLFFNFTQPAYGEVQKLKAEVKVREAFVSNQQQTVKKVQQLISSYNNQAELRDLLSLTLPLKSDMTGGFAQLAGLVQGETLGGQSYQITAGEKAASSREAEVPIASNLLRPLGTVKYQVSFSGSYDNLKSFLEKLESNVRIFDVTSLSVSPSQKASQDLYRVDTTLITHYQL
ncbi:MAG: hypothetical protein FJY98_01430 [Candidatus Liptonbacteria bacterium]|nr:hypothetical protein [Candidatus Liptonbacteria bacterium]